ncbi:MAG: AAA family ATPase [Rhodobacterales bacterium]|nr:AAA family ATPase [Rhodobacterales bacterium]
MPDRFATVSDWLQVAAHLVSARASTLLAQGEGSGAPFIAAAEAVALAHRLGQGGNAALSGQEATVLARLGDPDRIGHLPVARLCQALEVPPGLVPLLALMLLPESDAGFAQLFAYLNDDAQRRHLTPAIARRLIGELPLSSAALLAEDGPLLGPALIDPPDPGRAFDDRPLRLTDATVSFLMGLRRAVDTRLDAHLRPCAEAPLAALLPLAEDLDPGRLVPLATGPLVLLGPEGCGRQALAAALARHHHATPLALDARGLDAGLLAIALREAALHSARLILVQAEALPPHLLRRMTRAHSPATLISGTRLPTDAPHVTLRPPGAARALELWRATLPSNLAGGDDLAAMLAHRFRLSVNDLLAIAHDPRATASPQAAKRACLAHSSTALDTLAKRVETTQGWEDLILPDRQTSALRGLVARATHARRVYDTWGFGRKLSPDRGLTALFSGPSGAGKTLSASIIARALELPLYRVDLSTTVSKYIGETEKHLEQIFAAAEGGNACLFFDECDALFGKRSEVSDAHDRYANIETSYLLQRLETHRGIVILASNHPQNIDEAFTRRIDVTVAFPLPDADTRARLWRALLPPEAMADIDAATLGRQFALSGGSIRNCERPHERPPERPCSHSRLVRSPSRRLPRTWHHACLSCRSRRLETGPLRPSMRDWRKTAASRPPMLHLRHPQRGCGSRMPPRKGPLKPDVRPRMEKARPTPCQLLRYCLCPGLMLPLRTRRLIPRPKVRQRSSRTRPSPWTSGVRRLPPRRKLRQKAQPNALIRRRSPRFPRPRWPLHRTWPQTPRLLTPDQARTSPPGARRPCLPPRRSRCPTRRPQLHLRQRSPPKGARWPPPDLVGVRRPVPKRTPRCPIRRKRTCPFRSRPRWNRCPKPPPLSKPEPSGRSPTRCCPILSPRPAARRRLCATRPRGSPILPPRTALSRRRKTPTRRCNRHPARLRPKSMPAWTMSSKALPHPSRNFPPEPLSAQRSWTRRRHRVSRFPPSAPRS